MLSIHRKETMISLSFLRCSHLNLKQPRLNNFFSDVLKKLNISKFNSNNSVAEIKDPVFKDILKYKNHPRILEFQKYSKNKTFHFEEMNIGQVEK